VITVALNTSNHGGTDAQNAIQWDQIEALSRAALARRHHLLC
jgi:mRNA-degrading endonuclease toxin of MazEF toxin-antitoxin module